MSDHPAAEPTTTYTKAVEIASQLGGFASQSTLQRRLRLGYQDAHARDAAQAARFYGATPGQLAVAQEGNVRA